MNSVLFWNVFARRVKGKRSQRFTSPVSERRDLKILHYINTPKQLILDFYDCKNDNFHMKIAIVFFLFWLNNKLWVHPQSIFEQKSVKDCIPLSELQSFIYLFFIKVWCIRWSKLYELVFMIERF